MPEPEFRLNITNQSVNVRLDVSTHAGKTRFYALASFVGLAAIAICGILFSPGKQGRPSMWHDMSMSAIGSSGFLVPLLLLISFSLLMLILLRRYVTLAYPSDETFTADCSTLTIARVRWLDVHNNDWRTWSYTLAEVQDIRYRAIASVRGYSIYGLRFIAGGKTHRVLPGLKPRDAERILTTLKTFGADIADDTVLQRKLKEDTSRG
jgi:hypothetical protein